MGQSRRFASHLGLAALAAILITAAGCSGEGGGGATATGPGPIPPPSPSATATSTATPTATPTSTATATLTPTATPTPLAGSCLPASSLSVLVDKTNVTSYVPKGSWVHGTTGVSLVQVEGTGTTATLIPTTNIVNSCASDSVTLQTVCTANNTDVYLLSGSKLNTTLTSGGSGTINFSGGICTNCGVAFNPVTDQALIGLAVGGGHGGYQFLDLAGGTPTFETPIASPSALGVISEDLMIDPIRKFILSAAETNNYELAKIDSTAAPAFFENPVSNSGGELDASAEDCTTGIALASDEFTGGIFLADLSHATFTPGTPGTWSAPSNLQSIPDFVGFFSGVTGIAVAPPSDIGVVTGEFGGSLVGAIQLPSSAGGTPAITDWVACTVPNDPKGNTFSTGFDPHTVTAYVSPNTNDSIGVVSDGGPTYLAVIDLTKMLNTSIVPRTAGTHTCSAGTLPTSVVSYVAVP